MIPSNLGAGMTPIFSSSSPTSPNGNAVQETPQQPEPEPWSSNGLKAPETKDKDEEALNESAKTACNETLELFKVVMLLTFTVAAILLFIMRVVEPALQYSVASALVRLFKSSEAGMGAGMTYWGLPTDPEAARATIHAVCCYVQCSLSSVCIVIVFPMLHKRTSLVGWLLMLNMFLHRVIVHRRSEERPFHGFDLFLLAFVIAHLGLRHRAKVGTIVVRYWFVWVITCGLVWMPGTHERLDVFPPSDIPTRARVNFLEGFFIVAWLTAGEWFFDERIFTEDKLDFMNNWALAVFLLHKAIHILTKWPVNWTLILALIPICWIWKQMKSKF